MRPTVVIGFVGSTLDASKFGPDALEQVAAERRPVHARGSAGRPLRADPRRPPTSGWPTTSPPTSPESRRRPRSSCRRLDFADPWDFEEVYGKLLDFARAYPFDPEAEDYLDPHHHRHPRRPDLPVPPDRGALPSGPAAPDPARRAGTPSSAAGNWSVDRSRSVALRQHRHPLRRRRGRGQLLPQIGDRHPQRRLQPDDRRDRAGRASLARADAADGADRRRQVAARPPDLRAEARSSTRSSGEFVEVNCATLKGDSAMSALFGHRKGAFTGAAADRPGPAPRRRQGRALPRRDRRARPRRAGDDPARDRGEEVPPGRRRPRGLVRFPADRRHQSRSRHGASPPAASATICSRASTCGRSSCRRCATGARISSPTSITSSTASPSARAAGSASTRRRAAPSSPSRPAPEALLAGNFRDLAASVTRMATFAPGGRIDVATVEAEKARLRRFWSGGGAGARTRWTACSAARRSRRSTRSTGSSSPRWSGSAAEAARCPRPAAPCSAPRGRAAPRRTTPTGCANICSASDSSSGARQKGGRVTPRRTPASRRRPS